MAYYNNVSSTSLFNVKLIPVIATSSWFCSVPDYVPSWRNQENAAPVQEAALTDDLEIVSGPVAVTNPRWEHKKKKDEVEIEQNEKVEGKKEDKVEKREKRASFGDTIILMADVTGMPEGSGITFDIYEMSEDPPMVVASAKGKIENGVGKGEWVVEDKSGKGGESKLAFEGIAKSKASDRAVIEIVARAEEFVFTLYIDPEDPTSFDDKFILKGIDTVYEQTRTIADDKIHGDGMLTIAFNDVKKGEKYTLIHDDGQEQHTFIKETVYAG